MPAGETGGVDLTVETLHFLHDNWAEAAGAFNESWDRPVLRNHVSKSLYPSGETSGYTAQLRNNDVITVGRPSRTDSPTGTEFDFDVTAELDMTVAAMPGNGFSVIEDSTDWRRFVNIAREAILIDRSRPITDPDCRYDWRWITITNESPTPASEANRNLQETEFTVRWSGYESLSDI